MIKISGKLHPFSHQPQTICLIPGTQLLVEAFPALIRLTTIEGEVLKQKILDVVGPLKQFTVMQDLERGCVTVFSESYRFHILPSGDIIETKHPHLPPLSVQENLSLGNHKKQEWEEIRKRMDFREIFPIWFRLGSLLSLPKRKGVNEGVFGLLQRCIEAVDYPERIIPAFEKLFLAGFHHLCVPRTIDNDHQGILSPDQKVDGVSPLYLLTEGARLIRSLFFSSSENHMHILPHLPPEFHAGRMLSIGFSYGSIDMEWTKKKIRKLSMRVQRTGLLNLHFPRSIQTFRLRHSLHDKGMRLFNGEALEIKSDTLYLLDQFQK